MSGCRSGSSLSRSFAAVAAKTRRAVSPALTSAMRRSYGAARVASSVHIGAHLSSSGGIHTAVDRAEAVGAESLQVFTQSPAHMAPDESRPRDVRPLPRAARGGRAARRPLPRALPLQLRGDRTTMSTRSRSPRSATRWRSPAAIGADGVVLHVGSHLGAGLDAGSARVLPAMEQVLELDERHDVAADGELRGCRRDDRALDRGARDALRAARPPPAPRRSASTRATSTSRASTSPTPPSLDALLDEVDASIGLDRLRALHVNDSAAPLGSNRDRHANIGEGLLGEELGVFLGNPRLQGLPAMLETAGPGQPRARTRTRSARQRRFAHALSVGDPRRRHARPGELLRALRRAAGARARAARALPAHARRDRRRARRRRHRHALHAAAVGAPRRPAERAGA